MKVPSRKKILLSLVLLTAIVIGFFAFGGGEDDQPPVRTAKVERGTLSILAAASGIVEAAIQVDVKSRASGEVIEIPVEPGDTVSQGDLLVKLDPEDEENNLRDAELAAAAARARESQASAAVASARAAAADEAAKLARRRGALRAKLISEEEFASAATASDVAAKNVDQRSADLRSARIERERAEISIAEARRRLKETIIRSPITGTVISVGVELGTIVASGISNVGGGTSLLTVADLSKLYVMVALDEASIGLVKPGQKANIRIDAFPETVFPGFVDLITPLGVKEANIVTFAVRVGVTGDEAKLLLPGMSADVEIITKEHRDVLLIPASSLRTDTSEARGRGGRTRYVLLESGEKRVVKTGETDGASVIVIEGLAEGEVIQLAPISRAGAPKSNSPFSMMGGGRRR